MTAKISDCKKGSRKKIKQVISVESEREGAERLRCVRRPPLSSPVANVSAFSRTCAERIKDARRGRCCVAAMHSEK